MKKIEKESCTGISHAEQCAAICASLGCPRYSVQGVKMQIKLHCLFSCHSSHTALIILTLNVLCDCKISDSHRSDRRLGSSRM
jgi:hypothetical protein